MVPVSQELPCGTWEFLSVKNMLFSIVGIIMLNISAHHKKDNSCKAAWKSFFLIVKMVIEMSF